LAHSRLWDAVSGFLFIFAHMQDKLSKVRAFLALLYFLSITATVSHVGVSVFGIVANWVRCRVKFKIKLRPGSLLSSTLYKFLIYLLCYLLTYVIG